MNRDALLASLIGFGIGLVITGALIFGPNIAKNLPQLKLPTLPKFTAKDTSLPTPTTAPQEPSKLTIDAPLPEAIEPKAEVLVSGSAQAGSAVIIVGPSDEAVVQVASDGKYAGKVTLTEGVNELVVTSYKGDNQQEHTVTVFYTPEEY